MVARLSDGAQLKFLNSNLGGKEKTDAFVFLQEGRGSRCEHYEASLSKGDQRFNKESEHMHLAPDTYSRSIFKYATDGSSQVHVNGKVTIEQCAPGSDTHLLAKSLLLSENAISKVIPMLFVRNADVAAGHGSAMTPFSDDDLLPLP
jgi:Fe-S cluster assembly scaffold protein SufB